MFDPVTGQGAGQTAPAVVWLQLSEVHVSHMAQWVQLAVGLRQALVHSPLWVYHNELARFVAHSALNHWSTYHHRTMG